MAGTKKAGDLVKTIGLRLDRRIDEMVREIARGSKVVGDEPGVVIRTIVTAWFMGTDDPFKRFDELALEVNAWRKKYLAGVEAGVREAGQAKKESAPPPAKTPRKRRA